MGESLVFMIVYSLYLWFGGLSIKLVIDYFKEGKYYWFGFHLLNIIAWVFFMLKAMCSILN